MRPHVLPPRARSQINGSGNCTTNEDDNDSVHDTDDDSDDLSNVINDLSETLSDESKSIVFVSHHQVTAQCALVFRRPYRLLGSTHTHMHERTLITCYPTFQTQHETQGVTIGKEMKCYKTIHVAWYRTAARPSS